MSERIDLGYGAFMEGERADERNTEFHMRIVEVSKIPNTRSGHYCKLSCGHTVMSFGPLENADGVCLCVVCRLEAK